MKRLALLTALVLASGSLAAAQQTVFVVRHAERADTAGMSAPAMAADPDLSDAGRERARRLASMLRDARITAIYATEYKRTQQTAEPIAKALGLIVTVVPARDTAALIEKVKSHQGHALVVGHSNTVGDAIAALGIAEAVKVGDAEYDNLFVVLRGEKPALIRLRFK